MIIVRPLIHNRISMQKVSNKTDLDNTKITSIANYRSGQLSDATRLYRREQQLRKKMKNILDTNAHLERQIKIHENQIRDERANIHFQLSDLAKEMSLKFAHFIEERLEHRQFASNDCSHQTLQTMMRKYELIEGESQMLGKIFQGLKDIETNYLGHAGDMEELVINSENTSMEYQNAMETTLTDINEEIKARIAANQRLETHTQQLTTEIDAYVTGAEGMREEEAGVLSRIQKLKRKACSQQVKVDEIKEWAEIVIDKSNRKAVYSTIHEKQQYLNRLKHKNDQLEIYLRELDQEQHHLQKQKQNSQHNTRTPAATKRTHSKHCAIKKGKN